MTSPTTAMLFADGSVGFDDPKGEAIASFDAPGIAAIFKTNRDLRACMGEQGIVAFILDGDERFSFRFDPQRIDRMSNGARAGLLIAMEQARAAVYARHMKLAGSTGP